MTNAENTPSLDEVLDLAVQHTTGNKEASARPSQREIAHRIMDTIRTFTPLGNAQISDPAHLACEAPTGSGKGLAYLTPAALLAATSGARSLVTTESIALQSQLVTKDFPAVAAAVQETTGYTPTIAVHKGWANYPCALAAWNSAVELVGEPPRQASNGGRGPARVLALADMVESHDPLVSWVLRAAADGQEVVDKSHSPAAAERWGEVSVSTDACAKAKCPLYDLCVPVRARQAAAGADVVVTNHTLVAMQAARDIPVVMGSQMLGYFDAVIGDEAHALPGKVRDAGANMVSGELLVRLHRQTDAALSVVDTAGTSAAEQIADRLDLLIASLVTGKEKVAKIEKDDDPLEGIGHVLDAWAEDRRDKLRRAAMGDSRQALDARKVRGRLSAFTDAIDSVREGRAGVARWAQTETMADRRGRRWAQLHASPVDIGHNLRDRIWSFEYDAAEYDKGEDPTSQEVRELGGDESAAMELAVHHLPVVMVSATLPKSFCWDTRLDTKIEKFESPFADAFARSLLFIPKGEDAPTRSYGTKKSLDTFAHEKWGAQMAADLVVANGGRALVLTAKAETGRAYARHLREVAMGQFNVLDAWSMQREAAVRSWREDESSVLVGTRGLMTGVDLSGRGNTLVVIDRIPRAAPNPVDDARIDLLVTSKQISKWVADERVYVSDAAALLEQGAGRLIRSAGDWGMVAVLDPRLVKGPLAYRESVRKAYMRALDHFPSRTTSLETAMRYLDDHLRWQEAAA